MQRSLRGAEELPFHAQGRMAPTSAPMPTQFSTHPPHISAIAEPLLFFSTSLSSFFYRYLG
jgi:hypothetical protein